MKKISLLLFAAAAFTVSCKNTKATESQTKAASEAAVTPAGENTAASTDATAQNSTTVTTSTDGNRPALNPAHGEPYHRCDIQVGAPLDSPAPVQAAAPQVVPQQAPVSNNFNTNPISPSAAPSVSSTSALGPKPALNPAHGEPHHRCDLQVGAPLI
ncbi:MAG: hypothetical protein I8H68_01165 [Flavobacteriia bacterium]|nr:hypothetical protein [Flavobacteriia bacterium]MBH2023221.1 hypothetical protein [Flavobacteriales bacterium]